MKRFDITSRLTRSRGAAYKLLGVVVVLAATGGVVSQAHNRETILRWAHINPKYTPKATVSIPSPYLEEDNSMDDLNNLTDDTDTNVDSDATPEPTPSSTATTHTGSSNVSIHVENNNTSVSSTSSNNSSQTTVSGSGNSKVTTSGDMHVTKDPATGNITINGSNGSANVTSTNGSSKTSIHSSSSNKVNVSGRNSSSTTIHTTIR